MISKSHKWYSFKLLHVILFIFFVLKLKRLLVIIYIWINSVNKNTDGDFWILSHLFFLTVGEVAEELLVFYLVQRKNVFKLTVYVNTWASHNSFYHYHYQRKINKVIGDIHWILLLISLFSIYENNNVVDGIRCWPIIIAKTIVYSTSPYVPFY